MKKALLGFLMTLTGAANAPAQTPFYQGKTITIVVGYQAGDGYDIWARLLAAHMAKTHSGQSRHHRSKYALSHVCVGTSSRVAGDLRSTQAGLDDRVE